jgi:DNA-binding transcriptional MerR regulator
MPGEEKLFYTIGEAAQIVDVKPYVLRYWESEFRKLNPQKSVTGQRAYRKKDLEMAQTIKRLLYQEKFTIAGAIQKLEELEEKGLLQSPSGETRKEGREVPFLNPEETGEGVVPDPSGARRERVSEMRRLIVATKDILKKHNLA